MVVGESYNLFVKSTDIALAKDFSGTISVLNQLKATILSIRCEEILCSMVLDIDGFEVEAIVPKSSAEAMALNVGDSVIAFIKASEVAVC
ncbi:MAG TPA: molybdenum-pterin-binding protein [Nitratifractor sp.]|nr:molybdenum-pterin-binding protein [Nitratifractor sp.]